MLHTQIKLDDIVLFVEIARQLSFTKASEMLNIPASTLSRRFNMLEKSLGIKLIHRTTRSVNLTPIGQRYFERCNKIMQELSLAHEDIRIQSADISGVIRVSMTADFGLGYLAPIIHEFAEHYPEIIFDLDLSPNTIALDKEQFDVAIRLGVIQDKNLIAKYLGAVSRSLYASPLYLQRFGSLNRPEDLLQHRCIHLPSKYGENIWTLQKGMTEVSITLPGSQFIVNHIGMICYLATQGHGIAVLSSKQAQDGLKSGQLQHILPEWHLKPIEINAVFANRNLPVRVRKFIEFLASKISF